MDTKLIVSASPHLRSEETTQSLMANVIVALCPCVVASAIIFGARALLVTAVSVVACVAFEWLYCKLPGLFFIYLISLFGYNLVLVFINTVGRNAAAYRGKWIDVCVSSDYSSRV